MQCLVAATAMCGVAIANECLPETYTQRPTVDELTSLVTLSVEIGHGVYERCYATQYSTNPVYRVDPPDFMSTNGWSFTNGVLQVLDGKAKALVQYYVDSGTWSPDMGSFGGMFSVTGLWAALNIGDGINQFTGTPALDGNPATYGDYPWRTYPQCLQERYQVLHSLRWTVDNTRQATNESWYGMISYYNSIRDPWKSTLSNKNTQALTTVYGSSQMAIDINLPDIWSHYTVPTLENGEYKSVNTNFGFVGGQGYSGPLHLTWEQIKGDIIEGSLWGYGHWCHDYPLWGDFTGWMSDDGGESSNAVYTRFHEYETRQIGGRGLSSPVKPGTFAWAMVNPNSLVLWDGEQDWSMGRWNWWFCYFTGYAKWSWLKTITNGIDNTVVGVFALGGFQQPSPMPPFNPVGATETYQYSSYTDWYQNSGFTTGDWVWRFPNEWLIEPATSWSELAGLTVTNHVKLSPVIAGDWIYVDFGAGRPAVGSLDGMPPHPADPLKGNAFWDNTGSRGTAKGILVHDAFVVRDWSFQYCKY